MTDEEIIEAIRARPSAVALPDPASPEAVAGAEEVIGYRLPRLLRRLYLEVANGGFGPCGDVLGVPGGPWVGDWADIVDVHQAFGSGPEPNAPAWMVWLLDWGCAIWSLVDCRDTAGPMWAWDPNGCCLEHALFPQPMNLADWLSKSLDGALQIPNWSASADQVAHKRELGEPLPSGPAE
jgi:hypothetical protein